MEIIGKKLQDKTAPSSFILFTAILLLQVAARAAANSPTVPYFIRPDEPRQWMSIRSKQVVQMHANGSLLGPASVWLVDEHISLMDDLSWAEHSNEASGESFVLLTHSLRAYYADAAGQRCRLDQRQDRLSMFPWRHTRHRGHLETEPLVVGVAGLWLNAIQSSASCRAQPAASDDQSDASEAGQLLNCSLSDAARKVRLELLFDSTAGSADHFDRLHAAHVDQYQTVHLQQTSFLQDVRVHVQVLEMRRAGSLEAQLAARIKALLGLCRDSVAATDTTFPSLVRQVATSPQRAYWFSYIVSLYEQEQEQESSLDPPASGPARPERVERSMKVQEYFSYELEQQTVVVSDEAGLDERHYSMLAFQNSDFAQTLAYKLSERPRDCRPVHQIADPLGAHSTLSQRTVRFQHGPCESAPGQPELHCYSGVLRGLGALLMNAADLRAKSAPIDGFNVSRSSQRWSESVVEWLAEDELEALRFRFYLLPRSKQRHLSQVEDLVKVVVERLELRAVDDGQQQVAYTARRLMVLDILDFSTTLTRAKLESAFALPADCPPTKRFQLNRHSDGDGGDESALDGNAPEAAPQFPVFEQVLGLSRDYSLVSNWSVGPSLRLQLREFQALNEERRLCRRIDVVGQQRLPDGGLEVSTFSVYFNRSSDASQPEPIYRVEGYHCRRLQRLDGWLQTLSFEPDEGPNQGHRLYGLRALWSLASQSPYIEYLGQEGADVGVWRLVDEPKLLNLSLVFRFKLGRPAKLESVEIDASNSSELAESIRIDSVQVALGRGGGKSRFVLPACCTSAESEPEAPAGDNSKQEEIEPELRFPTFRTKFGGWPWEITFTIRYNYFMKLQDTSVMFKALEAHESHAGGRLDLWHDKQYVRLWLTEDNRTLLEQPTSGKCKLVRQLHQFLMLDPFIETIEGTERAAEVGQLDSNFALANLWELFGARLESAPEAVKYIYRKDGLQQLAEWSLRGPNSSVVFSFWHEGSTSSLHLQTISLKSLDEDNVEELVRLELMDMSQRLAITGLELPEQCAQRSQLHDKLPRLDEVFPASRGDLIHFRSEVASRQVEHASRAARSELFLLDELYDRRSGAFRSRSSSPANTFDYLIYADTKEFFDLSDEFMCSSTPPSPSSPDKTLAADWLLDNLFAARHDRAFHGPLAMWLFAERVTPISAELVSADESLSLLDLRDASLVDGWLSNERWRVTYQPAALPLAFTLQFSVETSRAAPNAPQSVSSWLVLDRVEATNWRHELAGEHAQQIQAEVVYGKEPADERQLLIPKGHGCRRGPLAERRHRLTTTDLMIFDPLSPVQFEYEASLSVADPAAGGALVLRPVVYSGWFARCPANWRWFPLGAFKFNHQRSHHLNGSLESRRWMLSEGAPGSDASQRRLLDERRGLCTIWEEHQLPAELLRLDFSLDGQPEEPIVIDDSLLRLLGTESFALEQIQLVNATGCRECADHQVVTEVVYEKRQSDFRLSSQLSGATSIIRTFRRFPQDAGRGNAYYVHQEASLEALVLGKARLTLNLKRMSSPDTCVAMLARASVEDCHQSTELELGAAPEVGSKVRSFVMRLMLVNATLDELPGGDSARLEELLREGFVGALATLSADLSPMQLGSRIHFDHDRRDQTLLVRFNLIEPPAAIEYFRKVFGKSIKANRPPMSSGSAAPMMRLAASVFACSEWCDAAQCVAFSYCQLDRSCQIVRRNSSYLPKPRTADNEVREALGFRLVDGLLCDYYFAPSARRRRPLSGVLEHIQQLIDQFNGTNFAQTFTLRLPVETAQLHVRLVASEFSEVTDNSRLFDRQAQQEAGPADVDRQEAARDRPVYAMLKAARALRPQQWLAGELLQAHSLGECLTSCSSRECQLFSYCQQQQLCALVSNITDGNVVAQVDSEPFSAPDVDCNIFSTDFLSAYREFDNTSRPTSFMRLVENVSVLECAAICQLQDDNSAASNCLSFDYCLNTANNKRHCYLQRMHVLMDSFDESILAQQSPRPDKSPQGLDGAASQCSHYSKSLLSDFSRLEGKRFVEHSSIVFNGTELNRCALICRQDDTCLAFEHCYREQLRPPNSCYIRRQVDPEPGERQTSAERVESDESCSVYRAKYSEEEFKVELGDGGDALGLDVYEPAYGNWLMQINEGRFRTVVQIILFLGTLFLTMVVGSLAHIMYIIVTGDRLPCFRH